MVKVPFKHRLPLPFSIEGVRWENVKKSLGGTFYRYFTVAEGLNILWQMH